ncbi:MAG TPA: flagellar protein FlgN [Candidatus Brocadiia bacterium]|nr:flagellar protein FlgN [Candidatus Brocadiales bacterium]
MANLLTNFIEVFDKITHLYGEILEVCKKKQACIVANNINELETLLRRESNLLETVILLEKKRLTLQKSLVEACNIKERKLTIRDLMIMLDEQQRGHLSATYSRISKVINELKEVNEINRSLTNYCLDLTNKTIELFCAGSFHNTIYQQSGRLKGSDLTRVIIDTAV